MSGFKVVGRHLSNIAITKTRREYKELSEDCMKFMLLVYGDENAWTESERAQCYQESMGLAFDLRSNGKFLATSPLHPVATAKSVRVRSGKHTIMDGPFAETREQLGGFFLVDVKDMNEALEIASRIPGARKGTVEVRPILELEGLPEEMVSGRAEAKQ